MKFLLFCVEVLQTLQCLWVWCKPWYVCSVHGAFNNGKKIGLLQGTGTCFVTWFYSMHWLLLQKVALKATIHNADFTHSIMNQQLEEAIKDIENKVIWKALYCLLHSVFLALKALWYCDSDKPSIDKIFFLVQRVDNALLKSQTLLYDEEIFGLIKGVAVAECQDELAEVFGESYIKSSSKLLRCDSS